jgi:predicted regulator of Ras-like GTPase activity (Roadblock/LC7/MglB family)
MEAMTLIEIDGLPINSMVIFNSKLLNYQRVLFNVMQVGDRNHKKIPLGDESCKNMDISKHINIKKME